MPPTPTAGPLYAASAFVIWGLFPLYFQFVRHVPPLELVLHRSAYSLCFVLMLLAWRGQWAWLGETFRQPRRVALFALTASLVAANWLIYVLAVQSGQVVEASLGYFINPLFNVLLGVLVLRERLRPLQWLAVALAAAGVLWLTWQAGRLPWIALTLALSFSLYGLLRKTAELGPLEGLALENILLAPIVLPALLWVTLVGGGALTQGDPALIAWLLLAGPLTALPLLFFAAGARRLKMVTLGMIQYISPSLQLMLGIWVFHEAFDARRLGGFMLIWSALALVSADAWRSSLRQAPPAV